MRKGGSAVALDFPREFEAGGQDADTAFVAFLGHHQGMEVDHAASADTFGASDAQKRAVAVEITKLSDDLAAVAGIKDRDAACDGETPEGAGEFVVSEGVA